MSPRQPRHAAGMTLVEAIVGIVIGLLVVGMVILLLSWTVRSLGRSDQRLDPRETAVRTLSSIRLLLADCRHYRIDPSGTSMLFESTKQSGRIVFDRQSGQVVMQPRSPVGARTELLASGIKDFSLHHLRRGLLQVGLEIDRPASHDGLQSLGPLRAVDEILIPIVALRNRFIPWHRTDEHRPGAEFTGPRDPGSGEDPGPGGEWDGEGRRPERGRGDEGSGTGSPRPPAGDPAPDGPGTAPVSEDRNFGVG